MSTIFKCEVFILFLIETNRQRILKLSAQTGNVRINTTSTELLFVLTDEIFKHIFRALYNCHENDSFFKLCIIKNCCENKQKKT